MEKILPLLFSLLCFWMAPLHAAEVQSAPACIKQSFKEVKTVTPFSLTHRPNSKRIIYADISCGLQWREKQCSSIQMSFDSAAVVYDFTSRAEIVISKAIFVQSPEITSPMGSGLVAFASHHDADTFLTAHPRGGKKLTYQDLVLLELP